MPPRPSRIRRAIPGLGRPCGGCYVQGMPCETCGHPNCQRPVTAAGWRETTLLALLSGRYYECMSCGARRRFPDGPRDPLRQSWMLLSGPSQW